MSIDISGTDHVEVVGESFYRAALRQVALGPGAVEPTRLHLATLEPEPTNPYDRNAIKVLISGRQIGHIPREMAAVMASSIADLAQAHGSVTARAEIRGSDSELGFGVVLHLDLASLGLVLQEEDEAPLVPDVSLLIQRATSASDKPPTFRSGISDEEKQRREQVVEQAVQDWKTELIDLTGRNRLLYMRDLRAGTLAFDSYSRDGLLDLVGGKKVALSKLIPRSRLPDNPATQLSPFEDAVRRVRAIVRTARTYEEERGVRTLYLTCGVATWRNDRASRPPAAPVLLVPLAIRTRGASQQDFDLSLAGDLEVNPTLLHLLKVEFNLNVDDQELYEHSDMDGVIDTPEELRLAFNWLSAHCASVPDWAITERFVLGNFWYAKLPMVRDLENSVELLASHDVASAFAGDGEARRAVSEMRGRSSVSLADVDHLAPGKEFNVLDSDSSQSLAIARALSGEDLVLKGPPGTGKSQTIANLICGAIGQGKRVLFVAEKRAAIEAVTKRLDAVDLGDLVLDLHRGALSRKWLAEQLETSLLAARQAENVVRDAEDASLARARVSLANHSRALHLSHEPWSVSVFDAQMEVLRRGRPSVTSRLRGSDLEVVTEVRLAELDEHLRSLLALGGLSLSARESPWAGVRMTSMNEARRAEVLVADAESALGRLASGLADGADSSGVCVPRDIQQAGEVIDVWERIQRCSEFFDLSVLDRDLSDTLRVLDPLQRSAMARLIATVGSSEYRSELAFVRERHRAESQPPSGELFSQLTECQELQLRWERVRVSDQAPASASADTETLKQDLARLRDAVVELGAILGRDLASISFDELSAALASLEDDVATVGLLPTIGRDKGALEAVGLDGFISELEAEQDLVPDARDELARVWWLSIVDHLMMEQDSDCLVSFRGELHRQILAEFRELDRGHVSAAATRVRRLAAEEAVRAQDQFPDQADVVRAQVRRKRGHMPVRELFAQAPDILTALRPCWVMSPLMVSQILPSERSYFDIVVFDEASQVRPVEAVTSIIRGDQLVVAGDERQLPPTAFFDAVAVSDGDEKEDDESTDIADYESLLDVLMTLFDTEMLRWHYRSRDERLIAFSNDEIYGGALTTFPGVVGDDVLRHELVETEPAEGEDRVTPDGEVRRVVEMVVEHARSRPEESLGVIALGIKHSDAIEAALLAEMPNHPELEDFFGEDREERFFVKNLERVQGDERDAIILAVGYGKAPDGTLPHRFGPLNQAGGERRLNVAITRAKRRMTVVSTFSADDIDLNRARAEGVRLLRGYLAYAAGGGSSGDRGRVSGSTVLHEKIGCALESDGLDHERLYGGSSDQIDLVVKDPAGGLPVVAIEIDGAAYAHRPSVRDRDRLRPDQLERLGWSYVRTWSQDWYRDPVLAARLLMEDVQAQMRVPREALEEGSPPQVTATQDDAGLRSAARCERGPRPNVRSGGTITDYRLAELTDLAEWINSDGLLRTGDELKTELMAELGITRRGSRVVRVLDEVVRSLRS